MMMQRRGDGASAPKLAGVLDAGHVITNDGGEVESASISGWAWLTEGALGDALTAEIRALAGAGAARGAISLPEVEVMIVRLEGAGDRRWLATIHARVERSSPAEAALTPVQREVASLAVTGSTIPEIARHMERSQETIRSHMREIYRRLDIASRVELVHALAPGAAAAPALAPAPDPRPLPAHAVGAQPGRRVTRSRAPTAHRAPGGPGAPGGTATVA